MRELVLAALLTAPLAGCTPSVEKTCDKYVALSRDEAAKRGAPLAADHEAKLRDRCLVDMRDRASRDSDAYACVADCLSRADDLLVAKTCVELCGPPEEPKANAPSP